MKTNSRLKDKLLIDKGRKNNRSKGSDKGKMRQRSLKKKGLEGKYKSRHRDQR
jgi:hypothetical protein